MPGRFGKSRLFHDLHVLRPGGFVHIINAMAPPAKPAVRLA